MIYIYSFIQNTSGHVATAYIKWQKAHNINDKFKCRKWKNKRRELDCDNSRVCVKKLMLMLLTVQFGQIFSMSKIKNLKLAWTFLSVETFQWTCNLSHLCIGFTWTLVLWICFNEFTNDNKVYLMSGLSWNADSIHVWWTSLVEVLHIDVFERDPKNISHRRVYGLIDIWIQRKVIFLNLESLELHDD